MRHGLGDSVRVRRNQANAREAMDKWAQNGGLAKRAVASPVPCTNPLGAYSQCGGIGAYGSLADRSAKIDRRTATGWTGSQCCIAGYTCNYVNDYYSQCQIAATSTSSATTCTQTGGPWDQCGGLGAQSLFR